MLASSSWWSDVPWRAVGAFVSIVTLAIGALKLAVAWGVAKQRADEQDRRIKTLEDQSDEIPDEMREKVKVYLDATESGNKVLRGTVAKVVLAIRQIERRVGDRETWCRAMHGDAVEHAEESISDRIEIPMGDDNGTQG